MTTVVVAAGCTPDNTGGSRSSGPTPNNPVEKLDLANIPGQYPTVPSAIPAGQDRAPVGSCVSLSGSTSKAALLMTDCGSPDTNYRVVQRVATPRECAEDVDRRYYNLDGTGVGWTACMDLAWTPDQCLSVGKMIVRRVSCSDTGAENRQKPVAVVTDTTTVSNCPSGMGFAHPVRRFTVCTETQK